MKKTLSTAVLAALAIAAVPAAASTGPTSGTVQVNGNVAAKCFVGTPIGGTINLGELAQEDGTVDPAFSKAGEKSAMFTVRCNGANPQLSVEALPLVNSAATQVANGYTNKVHYTAKLEAKRAKGDTTTVSNQSRNNGATTERLGDRLAAEANNLKLSISDGSTESTTAILDAGVYQGSVNVTITAPL